MAPPPLDEEGGAGAGFESGRSLVGIPLLVIGWRKRRRKSWDCWNDVGADGEEQLDEQHLLPWR